MDALVAAGAAFRGSMMASGSQSSPLPGSAADGWPDWPARRVRYAVWWSLFDGTAYRPEHPWSAQFRRDHGLYKHIKPVANPCARIVKFHRTHLLANGRLDPAAGDGKAVRSCLPILLGPDAREEFRPALARFWRDSRMVEVLSRASLFGAALGDVGFKVVADAKAGRMRLEVVPPGEIAWLDRDPTGTVVRAYDLRKMVPDPRVRVIDPTKPLPMVEYRETAALDGDDVVYETFIGKEPYPYNGVASRWRRPFGFIPFFVASHEDVGLGWSFNAFHPVLPKLLQVDDQTSGLSAQIRKAIRPPYFFSGTDPATFFKPGETERERDRRRANWDRYDARRNLDDQEEVDSLATPEKDARAEALVYPIDIRGARQWIGDLVDEITRDFPELRTDPVAMAGSSTATAIEAARSEATARILSCRVGYDSPLERAFMAGVGIGGYLKYRGYEGFDLDSFAAGHLDHTIGDRPVFDVSQSERLAQASTRATIIMNLSQSGIPLGPACLQAGMGPDEVAEVLAAKAVDDAARAEQVDYLDGGGR